MIKFLCYSFIFILFFISIAMIIIGVYITNGILFARGTILFLISLIIYFVLDALVIDIL